MGKGNTKILILSQKEIENLMSDHIEDGMKYVEEAFIERSKKGVMLPVKISQIFNEETQERLNCMPATLLNEKICGVKWVSVFPPNPKKGLKNVIGQILLSEIENGYPIAFMDGTWCTAFRTAAVGAIASKYLAKRVCEKIGFIGAGEQARMHFKLIKKIHPEIKKCYVASHTKKREEEFVEELEKEFCDVEFSMCESNYQKAAEGVDIIVTATSTQAELLKADWISEGTLYIHVGGWEDEYKVVMKADKIICDEWDAVKHRAQTVSRMYQEGIITDKDIYADFAEVITGKKQGRINEKEFIYFNSVGLAYIDIYLAYQIYKHANTMKIGKVYEL
nr:ornithine cyclodeaminase family protein [uncultured Sellimonas sp.]